MNTLIHADIFFFISTIAIVIITIVLCVVGGYVILIMRDAKYISKKLRHVSDELEEDFENLREHISEGGNKAKYLINFVLNKFLGLGKRKK